MAPVSAMLPRWRLYSWSISLMSSGTTLCLEGAEFQYPETEKKVLKGIDLEIRAGEWMALLGPNGSGKSTLLKLFNALLLPSQGRCFIDGMDTKNADNTEIIRSKVSMVFQNPEDQIVASVVEEEVAFGPENLGLPPEEIRQRVDRALRSVGLWEKRRAATYALSGGQKQRLALAGALALEPQVLVLDEATAMVDPEGRREFVAQLEQLHGRGTTLLQITHRLEEILMADRAVVLQAGRKVFDGTPGELFERPRDVAAWGLAVPPLVVLRQELAKAGWISPATPPSVEDLVDSLCP